jgi:RND family efflux transporter MFP subunit
MMERSVDSVRPGRSTATEPAPKSNRTAWLVGGVFFVAFLALVGVRTSQALQKKEAVAAQRDVSQAESKKVIAYSSVVAVPVRVRPAVELTGTLKPWREADIGFETPGRLVQVNVSTGSVVKQGQLLATLDGSRAGAQVNQADAQVRAARASLAIAEDNQKRTESLVASKSIPEAQAEQARQNVALARAQLDASQATSRVAMAGAGVHAITAPFAGVVTRAPSNPGSVVNPGVPVFRLEDVSKFRLMGTVGEEDSDLVALGAPVEIRYRDRVVKGVVRSAVPSLDAATRRLPIEVEVPNDPTASLLGNGFVRATIQSKEEVSGLRVPAIAKRPGSQNELAVVKDGKVRFVRVNHSTDTEGNWIVRSGLTEQDVLALGLPPGTKEGDAITVTPPAR